MAAAFTRPYLDALFAVAGSADAVEAMLPALRSTAGAVDRSPELRSLLKNPGVAKAVKTGVLAALGKKTGLAPLGVRLLDSLLANRRLMALSELLDALQERLDRERGVVEAALTTALPLDEKAHQIFKQVLERKTRSQVRLKPTVDPSLISGFVIRVGSEVFDCSLSHRLQMAKAALHSAA